MKKKTLLLLLTLNILASPLTINAEPFSWNDVVKHIVVGSVTLVASSLLWQFFQSTSHSPLTQTKQSDDSFDSVAGHEEVKEELRDIIDFLKNPEKFQKLGAQIPKGILLTGNPGTGKTLLARAIAGEAGCSFFSVNGADFVELYSGVGPARMRELYRAAQKCAPSIIFIDEIDAVGRHRSDNGDHGEYDNTLLQLLVSMDGFERCTKPIVFIGATNFKEALDVALLRPGRFDRIVHVPLPDIKNRVKILEYFAEFTSLATHVNLKEIAQTTVGFSGAHLKTLINEAAIIASRKNHAIVNQSDLVEARDKVIYGKALKTKILTQDEKRVIAVHESGHALVNLLLKKYSVPLYKMTIIPHGEALGFTGMMSTEDRFVSSKEELIARIMMLLGGRAAEEITFAQLSTGASDDFKQASLIAREMVMFYGMSPEVGTIFYDPSYHYSEQTLQLIDHQVKKILRKCYEETRLLLAKHNRELTLLSDKLVVEETLYRDDMDAILNVDDQVLADESFAIPAV